MLSAALIPSAANRAPDTAWEPPDRIAEANAAMPERAAATGRPISETMPEDKAEKPGTAAHTAAVAIISAAAMPETEPEAPDIPAARAMEAAPAAAMGPVIAAKAAGIGSDPSAKRANAPAAAAA